MMLRRKLASYTSMLLVVALLIAVFAPSALVKAESPTDSALYNFENGNGHGFQVDNGAALTVDASKGFHGSSSAKISYDKAGMFTLSKTSPGDVVKGGLSITFWVYVPSGQEISLQPYMMDKNWSSWFGVWYGGVQKNQWQQLKIIVPAEYATPITQFGVQIFTSGAGEIWFDSIDVSTDQTKLLSKIDEANNVYNAAVEGTAPGQYPAGSKDALLASINTAVQVKDNPSSTQAEIDQAVSMLDIAIAAFMAKAVTVPENIVVNYNNVISTIKHDFWGVNYVAFWDDIQGSGGSKNALREAGIDYIRFPGGEPGNWYDWSTETPSTTTRPIDLWNYAQGVGADILWETNPTTNTVNNAGKSNDPSGQHVTDMIADFNSKGMKVKYYEVGNELDIHMREKRDPNFAWYMDKFNEHADAIHAADKDAMVVGPAGTNAWFWWALESLKMFLEKTGNKQGSGKVDGVSLHWYGAYQEGWNYAKHIASDWKVNMDYIKSAIQEYDTRDLPVFITETSASYTGQSNATGANANMTGALATADLLGAYRDSGVQSVSLFGSIHGVRNSWGLLYGKGEDRPQDTPTPTYFTLPIWTKTGNNVLSVAGMSNARDSMSAYASKKDDGSSQVVIINKEAAPKDVTVSFDGFKLKHKGVKIYEMKAANGSINDLDVYYNGQFTPDPAHSPLPAPVSAVVEDKTYTRKVPGYSLTLLDFSAEKVKSCDGDTQGNCDDDGDNGNGNNNNGNGEDHGKGGKAGGNGSGGTPGPTGQATIPTGQSGKERLYNKFAAFPFSRG